MPVDDILPTTGVPVELHFMPQLIDLLNQRFLIIAVTTEILAGTEQTCHQEATLHQIATIVLLTERLHTAGLAVEPMWPYTMEPVGLRQPIHYLVESLQSFGTRDKAPLNTHNESGNTKATTACGDHILIVLRIVAIGMDTLASQARGGFCPIPHIVEMNLLDVVE